MDANAHDQVGAGLGRLRTLQRGPAAEPDTTDAQPGNGGAAGVEGRADDQAKAGRHGIGLVEVDMDEEQVLYHAQTRREAAQAVPLTVHQPMIMAV